MKIVADENIPLVREVLGGIADVHILPGRSIERSHLIHADVLLVRSVTRVDRKLLEGTAVRYVGTATSGTDHICERDLESLGIKFGAAPGSNARAVVEYVIAVLAANGRDFTSLQFGVVGCGQVGGRLYRLLKSLGCRVCCYDPFLGADEIADLTTLEVVMSSDVVSLHTPLTTDGEFPTLGMIGSEQLALLPNGALLINAGRGGVIKESELLDYSVNRRDVAIVLDVWEGEPGVNSAISNACLYLTPHIAGYSELAKLRGAQMVLESVPGAGSKKIAPRVGATKELHVSSWQEAALAVFDPVTATAQTRHLIGDGTGFDQLRKGFGSRLEFSQVSIQCEGEQSSVIRKLGFATL